MTKSGFVDITARFYADRKLGRPVRIDNGFHCTVNIELGNYVHISPYVVIIGGADAKFIAKGFNNIMIGSKIICASDRFDGSGLEGSLIPDEYKGKVINEPVIMDEFSNMGAGSIMMPGSRLRKGSLLTMNSVLFGDTEEWGVYDGNPATLKHKIDGKLKMKLARKLKNG